MKAFFHATKSSSEKAPMSDARALKPITSSSAPTVIELFQSQGCSSCPPTNANILKLLDNPNFLILTYHVTYWDHMGWKDTFGSPDFDARQREYAKALQSRNVYTPQVIVNGQVEGVGNNFRDLERLIARGKEFSATQTIQIAASDNNSITVDGPQHEHGLVTVVMYDSSSVNVPILRGENGGHTLAHNNVVKGCIQIGHWSGGSQHFNLPKVVEEGLRMAVLVTAGPGGPILGALGI